MAKKKYIDIDVNDDQKAQYLAILNSEYFIHHPDDDLETAFEVLYGNGISNFFNNYPFTHEQAFEIKRILEKKFDSQNIIRFIMKLRFILEGAACLLNQQDYKTYKNDRKAMLAIMKKSSDLLDSIRNGRSLRYLDNFSVLLNEKRSELEIECLELAATTGNLLSILIRKLKNLDDTNEQRIKGRPNADSKGIVAEIARIWESCFNKKPTQYNDGSFVDVVKVVLEGLKLKYEYPQRKIKAAVKTKLE